MQQQFVQGQNPDPSCHVGCRCLDGRCCCAHLVAAELQDLYSKFGSKGFTVIGFPCNQVRCVEACVCTMRAACGHTSCTCTPLQACGMPLLIPFKHACMHTSIALVGSL